MHFPSGMFNPNCKPFLPFRPGWCASAGIAWTCAPLHITPVVYFPRLPAVAYLKGLLTAGEVTPAARFPPLHSFPAFRSCVPKGAAHRGGGGVNGPPGARPAADSDPG